MIKNTKKIILISIIGVVILTLAIFIVFRTEDQEQKYNNTENDDSSIIENNQYQSQTKSQAEVTVDIVPKKLGIQEEENIFTVNFNTHSVELDFDFSKIIILKDDIGNLYPATKWTGNSGWHHVNGDIIFSKINKQASSIELQILGINGVDRNFKWILK